MKRIEDDCKECTSVGLHCLGISCPNRNITVYYCDKCGDEADYHADGEDLCEECLKRKFRRED